VDRPGSGLITEGVEITRRLAASRTRRPECNLAGCPHDPLQLGGDPNGPRNLWVEPPSPGHKPGAGPNNPKDAVETHLHTAICHGTVTLTAAQHAIATDWTTAESVLGITRPQ
jgi:hypothetical protein